MIKQHFLLSNESNDFELVIRLATLSNASLQLKLVLAEVSIYSIPHESACPFASL